MPGLENGLFEQGDHTVLRFSGFNSKVVHACSFKELFRVKSKLSSVNSMWITTNNNLGLVHLFLKKKKRKKEANIKVKVKHLLRAAKAELRAEM